jgi:hypothetical protein
VMPVFIIILGSSPDQSSAISYFIDSSFLP